MAVKHLSRSQHDEPGSNFREDHAHDCIDTHIADKPADEGFPCLAGSAVFLNLLRGLPEEHVRRDCRAEHADKDHQKLEVEMNAWNEGGPEDSFPALGRDKPRHEICKERY